MSQQTSVRLNSYLLRQIDEHRPKWKSQPRFLEDCLAELLDTKFRLADTRSPQAGNDSEGGSPSKAVNKRNKEKEIPGNLWGHADLIRAYWTAKPKTKTDAAWKLLMTELAKIQDGYGDAALRTQLELAEANRWQGITLANYERFGLPKGNGSAQGKSEQGFDWEAIHAQGPIF